MAVLVLVLKVTILFGIDECDNQDLVLMTELKYTFRFKHRENRIFDLKTNGPLSRFLLAAPETTPCSPVNITYQPYVMCSS